ncbi:uncharacterized protein [Bemisia tabaci]|uniref:uncharacterized protein n=1 Tax=Bemisia tabaci TaxID=7038 RepID=UPI003B27F8D3
MRGGENTTNVARICKEVILLNVLTPDTDARAQLVRENSVMCGVVSKITILLMLSKLLENDALKRENRGLDGTLFEPAAEGFNMDTAKSENEKRYFPWCLRRIFRRKISTSEPDEVRLERVKEMIRNDWCRDPSLQATIKGMNTANQRCRDAVAALISLPDSYKTYKCLMVTQGNCRPQPGGYRCTVHPYAWELLFRENVFYKHGVKRNHIYQLSQCIKPSMLAP